MSRQKPRVPVYAANWKMNVGPAEAREFMREFLAGYPVRDDQRVIFFPPAVSLAAVMESAEGRRDLRFGVQNIYFMDSGAYTGEISGQLARDAGADFTLCGHSERRTVFNEDDDSVRKRVRAAIKYSLTPVLCVGETAWEREDGKTADVVGRQLRAVIGHLSAEQTATLMIAYEPVWAIGTGKTATPDDAATVHQHIRHLLRQAVGKEAADGIHILYGGSVKPENVAELMAAPEVDGVLVGGASTRADSWVQIVNA